MNLLTFLLIALIAYLIGSFSSGIALSVLKGRDVRKEGSKSTGATNVSRVLGLSYGLLTFAADFLKACLALLLGYWIAGIKGAMTASVFVVIGHNWPVYYRFQGGKGIVCSLAVLLMMCPREALIASAAALIVIALTKYVSLGSLTVLALSFILIVINRGFLPYGWWSLILLVLGVFQHRENIKRILTGSENRFSLKNKPAGK